MLSLYDSDLMFAETGDFYGEAAWRARPVDDVDPTLRFGVPRHRNLLGKCHEFKAEFTPTFHIK